MPSVQQLSVTEYAALREAGQQHVLLDVREAWEIETAAIEGARCIPLGELHLHAQQLQAELANTLIVCLCHAGIRSAAAANALAASGCKQVANIIGGIDAWSLDIDPNIPRY